MFDIAMAVLTVAVTVVVTTFAVLAIRTGWLLPWLRAKTLRPHLWGCSSLLGAVGMCVMYASYRVDEPTLLTVAVFAFLGSWYLSLLADRPGRVRPSAGR
ncbi:hypothetical protein ACWD4G_24470 [Streptomyces sp. NPDC002643]